MSLVVTDQLWLGIHKREEVVVSGRDRSGQVGTRKSARCWCKSRPRPENLARAPFTFWTTAIHVHVFTRTYRQYTHDSRVNHADGRTDGPKNGRMEPSVGRVDTTYICLTHIRPPASSKRSKMVQNRCHSHDFAAEKRSKEANSSRTSSDGCEMQAIHA